MAEGRTEESLAGFAGVDRLAPPIDPREFLAAAQERAGRIRDSLTAWLRIANRPALVWVSQPDRHLPGIWTHSLLRVADLSLREGRSDEGGAALKLFLKIREHADAESPESILARKLLTQGSH